MKIIFDEVGNIDKKYFEYLLKRTTKLTITKSRQGVSKTLKLLFK